MSEYQRQNLSEVEDIYKRINTLFKNNPPGSVNSIQAASALGQYKGLLSDAAHILQYTPTNENFIEEFDKLGAQYGISRNSYRRNGFRIGF